MSNTHSPSQFLVSLAKLPSQHSWRGEFALPGNIRFFSFHRYEYRTREVPEGGRVKGKGIRSSKNYQEVTFIRTRFRCVSVKDPFTACHRVVFVPLLFLRNNSLCFQVELVETPVAPPRLFFLHLSPFLAYRCSGLSLKRRYNHA